MPMSEIPASHGWDKDSNHRRTAAGQWSPPSNSPGRRESGDSLHALRKMNSCLRVHVKVNCRKMQSQVCRNSTFKHTWKIATMHVLARKNNNRRWFRMQETLSREITRITL
jgi:hypothetical protein